MSNPSPAGPPGSDRPTAGHAPDDWHDTRGHDEHADDAYLANGRSELGRPVGEHRHELFVAGEPGVALQQQFERLPAEFIAIHDVATSASRKLIAGIASASKGAVQRLAVRRQGPGTPLVTLEFVELPTAEGPRLRIYATECDADPATRDEVALALLGFSTLGVLLVGDAPGASISGVFQPLHDRMVAGPWRNRHLLLLPLSTANALVTQGMELSRGTGVNVRTTPQVARPADAWNFISSTWTRLRDEAGGRLPAPASAAPPPVRAPEPLPLQPMPGVATGSMLGEDLLTRYVKQLSGLTGMVSCCIFDVATGRDLLHAGARPGPEELAEHGSELMAAMLTTSRVLGLGHALPEAAITLGSHHLVLRPVPRHPGLALHAVLDKTNANLTLARLQIARMDALFETTPGA